MNQQTPLAEQIRIVLYGLRNSGKSSLMNNLFEKEIAIVSNNPGTTTDPITRSIELGQLGPVAVSDTAGFDDVGELGQLRVKKTATKLEIADMIILVSRADQKTSPEEIEFLDRVKQSNKSIILAITFADQPLHETKKHLLEQMQCALLINNLTGQGIKKLRKALIQLGDQIETEITPLEGLVQENELVLLVTPIDLAAPRGRLILPQVETIRDLLDKDCACLVVKERELNYFYDCLKIKPKLVVTDSQAFSKVAADIPQQQLLTSFSILFARKKGDLSFFVQAAKQLQHVPPGVKILVLESCSHHRQADDIGTVKIPRLFKQLVQSRAEFHFSRELPGIEELKQYFMVINCAGCMASRRKIMSRLQTLKQNNIYALNYGLFLAWVNGLLPRALAPFTYEFELYQSS